MVCSLVKERSPKFDEALWAAPTFPLRCMLGVSANHKTHLHGHMQMFQVLVDPVILAALVAHQESQIHKLAWQRFIHWQQSIVQMGSPTSPAKSRSLLQKIRSYSSG